METTIANRWQDYLIYQDERPSPQTIIENERVRVIVAGLNAGQQIPVHPEAAAVYQFLESQGVMTVNGERFAVQPGSIVVMGENAQRGLLAETQLSFLAIRLA